MAPWPVTRKVFAVIHDRAEHGDYVGAVAFLGEIVGVRGQRERQTANKGGGQLHR
jgi:hypothetical protein